MEADLLHLIPALGRILRVEHVCRGRRRKLPSLPGGTGEGGAGPEGGQAGQEDRGEEAKYDFLAKFRHFVFFRFVVKL